VSDAADGPLVSYILATYGRPDELREAVDSIVEQTYRPLEIVVVGETSDEVRRLFEAGGRFDEEWIHYHRNAERRGPGYAKNIAYEHATGDVVVQIDDDAVLLDEDATDRVVSLFDEHEDVGILAFQSRNADTDEVKLNETPDPPEFHMTPTEEYRATNFVGVGCAFRRDAIEAAGGLYPDNFTYGFEEMDLSLRVHDTGYDILYTPSIAVAHKKSPGARRETTETQVRLVESRIKLAVRNLPWRFVAFTTLGWSLYAIALTRSPAALAAVFRGVADDWRELLAERRVIDDRTITRIKSRKTMLYFWWYGPHPGRILPPNGNLDRLKWEA